jgi:hypothetical protein
MKNLDNANLNSSSISLNNQKYTNQKNNNLQKTEITNQYQKDIIDISSSSSKTLIAQNGEKVNLKFDNNNFTITVNKTGVEKVIKRENLSENLRQISNLHEFNKFLDNSYAKITMLSDGEIKVDVNHRLHGGMMSSAAYKQSQQQSSPIRRQTEQKLGTTIKRGDALEHSLYDMYFSGGINPSVSGKVHKASVPHSSIYVGNDKVVEIRNRDGKGIVEKNKFVDTYEVIGKYVNDPQGKGMYDRETIAQRAESKLGKSSHYDLWYHNCHNFTNWCRTGVDYNQFGGNADKGWICTYKTWDNI